MDTAAFKVETPVKITLFDYVVKLDHVVGRIDINVYNLMPNINFDILEFVAISAVQVKSTVKAII